MRNETKRIYAQTTNSIQSYVLLLLLIWYHVQRHARRSHQFYYHLASFHFENTMETIRLYMFVCFQLCLIYDTTHIRWFLPMFFFYWTKWHCFIYMFFLAGKLYTTFQLSISLATTHNDTENVWHVNEWKMMNVTINQENWYIITCNNTRVCTS